MSNSPRICPNCGTYLKENALNCYHCGSDHETGWSENTIYDDIGLEDISTSEKPSYKYKIIQDIKILILVLVLLSLLWLSTLAF